jgi:IclR family pca regulon transcriptional regulator
MPDDIQKGRTIARTVLIIDALAQDPAGVTLAEIARNAEMTPPGAHRALTALIAVGVASQESPRGRYRLGPRVLSWSSAMTLENRLLAIADKILSVANDETGETVILTVMRDRRLWNIASWEGHGPLVVRGYSEGEPYLHSSARGLVFLAHLPREQAEAIIAETGLPAVPPNRTITDPDKLWSKVDRARRKGFVWRRDPTGTGTSGVAVPVLDPDGRILATIVISMSSVLPREKEKLVEAAAIRAARAMEEEWARTNVWSG